MLDPNLIIDYSPLGIAGMSLVLLFYFFQTFNKKFRDLEENDIKHIEESLERIEHIVNEIRDYIRSADKWREEEGRKIDYLYEEFLRKR